MGLNAFFAYGVVLGMGHTWQVALGTVFVSGVLFLILSVVPVRRWIIEAIPQGQKLAIASGIGLFLGIIALRNAGIIQDSPATLVTVGDLTAPAPILALLGFCAIVALASRQVPGAAIIGMLGVTVVGLIFGGVGMARHRIAAAGSDGRRCLPSTSSAPCRRACWRLS